MSPDCHLLHFDVVSTALPQQKQHVSLLTARSFINASYLFSTRVLPSPGGGSSGATTAPTNAFRYSLSCHSADPLRIATSWIAMELVDMASMFACHGAIDHFSIAQVLHFSRFSGNLCLCSPGISP
jgi:hypothetical protein